MFKPFSCSSFRYGLLKESVLRDERGDSGINVTLNNPLSQEEDSPWHRQGFNNKIS